jgi:hypothetical protein
LRNDFCIFILSHGRAEKIHTLDMLNNLEYSGKWFIVIDNEDKTSDQYFEKYGTDKVIMFDKDQAYKKFDRAENFTDRKVIFAARNICFDLAKELNYKYFMELDDDYKSIDYRFNKDLEYNHKKIETPIFDHIIDNMIKFIECNKNIVTITLAQGGDFIGGTNNPNGKRIRIKRKAMNSFLCSTEKPFNFIGNINEDVNTYVRLGQEGKIFIMLNHIALEQYQTQKQSGGMTEIYLKYGTYVKSFYTVMICPSCVKISMLINNKSKRMHHKISWKNAVPCIINEKYKKLS